MNNEAKSALQLANSYLDDAENVAPDPSQIHENNGPELMRLVDLAAKQIAKAQKADPTLIGISKSTTDVDGIDFASAAARTLVLKACAIGFGQNKKTEGVKLFRQALEICPIEYAPLHAYLASLLTGLGKRDEAILHAKKAIEIEPDEIGHKKLLDQIEGESKLSLVIGAFQGSRRFLFAMGTIAFIGVIVLFNGAVGLGLLLIAFGSGVGALYWVQKSK